MTQLQNSGGLKVTNRLELTNIATQFYKTLYAKLDKDNLQNNLSLSILNEETISPFTESEIEFSISKLKVQKSPGPDGITKEMIKKGKTELIKPLTNLFNKIIEENQIPNQLSCSEIKLIYKKGDPTLISNYRPISLLPCLYKLYKLYSDEFREL